MSFFNLTKIYKFKLFGLYMELEVFENFKAILIGKFAQSQLSKTRLIEEEYSFFTQKNVDLFLQKIEDLKNTDKPNTDTPSENTDKIKYTDTNTAFINMCREEN